MNWYAFIKTANTSISIDTSKYELSLREKNREFLEYKANREQELATFQFNPNTLFQLLQQFNYPDINGLNQAIQSNNSEQVSQYMMNLFSWRNQLEKSKQITFKQGMDIWTAVRQLRNLIEVLEKQEPDYQDIPNEQYEQEIVGVLAITYKNMETIAGNIRSTISRIEGWRGSSIIVEAATLDKDSNYMEPMDAASIKFSDSGEYAPDFSYFVINGKIEIDDVLEAGDTDFFTDANVQMDYFKLVNELRNPGSSSKSKFLTLYTARPIKDREMYAQGKGIPSNIYLTNSFESAQALIYDLPGVDKRRDIWKVVIDSRYLVQTLDGMEKQYQAIGEGTIPVKSMTLLVPG